MCRSIKTLRPPYAEQVTDEDIRAAALQYVRKISGFRVPAGHNAEAFGHAVDAVAAALELERRYDISPASLAFGLRVLAEPAVRACVADLGRRLGRLPAPPGRALDFEKERALRLLSRG